MIQIDLPLPDDCSVCPCNNDFVSCGVTKKNFYEDGNAEALDKRPEWCPLKEVNENERKLIIQALINFEYEVKKDVVRAEMEQRYDDAKRYGEYLKMVSDTKDRFER